MIHNSWIHYSGNRHIHVTIPDGGSYTIHLCASMRSTFHPQGRRKRYGLGLTTFVPGFVFCLSLFSLSLSPSFSLYHPVSLPLPSHFFSPSALSLPLTISPCLARLSPSLSPFPSHFSLFLSPSLSLYISHFSLPSLSPSLYIPLSLAIYLYIYLSLSPSPCPALSPLPVSFSLSLSFRLSPLSLSLIPLFLSPFLSISPCLSPSLSLPHLYFSLLSEYQIAYATCNLSIYKDLTCTFRASWYSARYSWALALSSKITEASAQNSVL